jgi:hypothetical protein
MDTQEARMTMRDLAGRGLAAVDRYRAHDETGLNPMVDIRGLQLQARTVLADAGYPGEAVWQALNHAYFGFEAYGEPPDSAFWGDIVAELQAGMATLDGLLMPPGLGADFPIIG